MANLLEHGVWCVAIGVCKVRIYFYFNKVRDKVRPGRIMNKVLVIALLQTCRDASRVISNYRCNPGTLGLARGASSGQDTLMKIEDNRYRTSKMFSGAPGRPARASLSIAALYRSLGAPCGVSREALVVSHVYHIFHGPRCICPPVA